jgi:hypothetical protein
VETFSFTLSALVDFLSCRRVLADDCAGGSLRKHDALRPVALAGARQGIEVAVLDPDRRLLLAKAK